MTGKSGFYRDSFVISALTIAIQVVLVVVTTGGIIYQNKLFNLEREYKEVSIRPLFNVHNPRYDLSAGISNIGSGTGEIVEVSYVSDSYQMRVFNADRPFLQESVDSIVADLDKTALSGIVDFAVGDIKLDTFVSFKPPKEFITKDSVLNFAALSAKDFYEKITAGDKSREEADQNVSLIRQRFVSNQSKYNIGICYCSVTRKWCDYVAVGNRESNRLDCTKWQRD